MYFSRSPPKYSKFKTGGSNTKNKLINMPMYASSTNLMLSNNSVCSSTHANVTGVSNAGNYDTHRQHSNAAHYHHQHYHEGHQHTSTAARKTSSASTSSSFAGKRGKRHWGTRERSGMSFLIVIAFFAVFGIIILTEVLMIDERSHNGVMSMRHGNSYIGRLGDSMPDYDNVKDDYDLLDESILSDNKLGFIQFRDNKLKIHDAASNDGSRYAGVLLNSGGNGVNAGGGGGGIGNGVGNMLLIPWGKVLPGKVEETLPRYPIGSMPTDGSWQVVNGTRFKFFVFSAYYDKRDDAKLVRVVGATKTRGPERVWCRFWYIQRNASTNARPRYTSATVMARVKIIRENWNLKYSACFVLCPVRSPELEVPHYVSIVARLRTPPGNVLELRNTDWDKDFAIKKNVHPVNRNGQIVNASLPNTTATQGSKSAGEQIEDKIAVCVKPFHFNYDQALYLMEYLEFYALLGVSHFTFYNHTIGPQATCVLEHYIRGDIPEEHAIKSNNANKANPANAAQQSTNVSNSATIAQVHAQNLAQTPTEAQTTNAHYVKPTVTMLPWNLRMRSQKEIRTEGLFAALNDCLYRTMYRYKYLALVDLDEFIVPRRTDTLNELISSLNRRFRNRNAGAYSFQNAFFYLQFPDDPLATEHMDNQDYARTRAALVTQRKTKRRFKLHPQKQRSKYICKPEAVVEAGNHFVWEFSPGKGSLNVPAQDAILQHYRVCEFGGNDCIKAPSVVDRTAMKYANQLVRRVDTVYKHLKKSCQLPDMPALPKQTKQKKVDKNLPNTQIKANNDWKTNETNTLAIKSKLSNNKNNEQNKFIKSKETVKTTSNINTDDALINSSESKKPLNITAKATHDTSVKNNNDDHKFDDNKNNLKNNNKQTEPFRKRRKMIIFERDEFGDPIGRIEYV